MCSSVGIVTAYGLRGWGSIPGRDNMSLLHSVQTDAHPAYEGPFPGIKGDGGEAGHLSLVPNGEAILSLPHTSSWRGA